MKNVGLHSSVFYRHKLYAYSLIQYNNPFTKSYHFQNWNQCSRLKHGLPHKIPRMGAFKGCSGRQSPPPYTSPPYHFPCHINTDDVVLGKYSAEHTSPRDGADGEWRVSVNVNNVLSEDMVFVRNLTRGGISLFDV